MSLTTIFGDFLPRISPEKSQTFFHVDYSTSRGIFKHAENGKFLTFAPCYLRWKIYLEFNTLITKYSATNSYKIKTDFLAKYRLIVVVSASRGKPKTDNNGRATNTNVEELLSTRSSSLKLRSSHNVQLLN